MSRPEISNPLLEALVQSDSDNHCDLIILRVRGLALQYGWDVAQMKAVADMVLEVRHQTQQDLTATVMAILRDAFDRAGAK